MWGAIIGDIVGSRFENQNLFSEHFEMFDEECSFTDDTVMTVATLLVLQENKKEDITEELIEKYYRKIGCPYLQRGFGGMFFQWLMTYNQKAYGSYGNGALMRISSLAKWAYENNCSKEEMQSLGYKFTNVTHNHPQAHEAVSLYLNILFNLFESLKDIDDYSERERISSVIIDDLTKNTIYENIENPIHFKLKNTQETNLSCEFTLKCVLSVLKYTIQTEENSYTYKFEYGLKKIISLGGDCDTTAAILGAILEIIYGIAPAFKYSAYKIAFKEFDKPLIDAINKLYNENVESDVMYVTPRLIDIE